MITNRLFTLNRFQAAGFHFLASAAVIAVIFGVVKLVWYPQQLFEAANGFDLLKILVLVDLVLGPLIMLIIFNPKKKSLKFDVSAVLICQLLFLGYGVWSLYTVRPAYIAFVEKQFHLVKANEVEDADMAKAENSDFKNLPKFGPVFVGTKMPDSEKERENILFAGLGNMGIQNLPQYYIPFKDIQSQVLAACKSIENQQIERADKEQLEKIKLEMEKQGKNVLFCPLISRGKRLFVVIDASNGTLLGMH